MTTFEHAMVGVCGTFSLGLHRRHGWRLPAIAGVAAVSPDWDGLTFLFSIQLFDAGHRVWGHNLLVAAIIGLFLGWLDAQYDLMGKANNSLRRILRQPSPSDVSEVTRSRSSLIWCVVAMCAAVSHLPADIVYSGGQGLSDWELQILWPFSTRGFVFPMVRWGDIGATLLFVAGMFAMLRWPARVRPIAAATLGTVMLYVIVRGIFY
jgi:membrane-bound metal-dependent hydrolase YbcI (DUF457 family)